MSNRYLEKIARTSNAHRIGKSMYNISKMDGDDVVGMLTDTSDRISAVNTGTKKVKNKYHEKVKSFQAPMHPKKRRNRDAF